jgi:hypothetical protein
MARIIPGVQVAVIKEVVPPQLAPSGVLGLVGLVSPPRAGTTRKPVERVGSWGRFRELYGSATALAMPEAQAALQNGVYELVMVEVAAATATAASANVSHDGATWLSFSARTPGTAPNGLALVLAPTLFQGKVTGYELRLRKGSEDIETHRNLSPFPGAERWFGRVLTAVDSIVQAALPNWTVTDYAGVNTATLAAGNKSTVVKLGTGPEEIKVLELELLAGAKSLQLATTAGTFTMVRDPGGPDQATLVSLAASSPELPQRIIDAVGQLSDAKANITLPSLQVNMTLAGGIDASVAAYVDALEQLVDVPDVDLVIASIQDLTTQRAASIYGAVIAHCENMSADAKGRLGFGQVPKATTLQQNVDLVGSLVSDRFTLFAPHGTLGAAVGRIGSLPYYHSPTFKTLAGLGTIDPALRVEAQRQYLTAKVVPVAELQGRGNVIVRGLTTDGDQINVRRVADRAVRGVRQIGELFIGKLNTEDGRNALKQKLNEFLLQMSAESAIVPSTDGSDPAFKLDVYSTQADFALGIVRVDMAIRPVRAIDYIYATVLVQV